MQDLPILAIDISTNKIISVAAKFNKNNEIVILSVGHCPSSGMKKGKITNMDLATLSIKKSIDKLKETYSGEFSKIYVNLPSVYAQLHNSKAMVNVPSGKISTKEIKTVLNTAINNASISSDYEVIHAIPNHFMIDGSFIQDPQSYITNHLEAKVNIIAVSKNYLNNIRQALRDYGLDSIAFVVNSYVTAQAIADTALYDNSSSHGGLLVVDIGSSSTYASICKGKSCIFSKFYPIGGNNISKDIALMLNTNFEDAENYKIEHGAISISEEEARQKVKLPKSNNNNSFTEVSTEYLSTIIHCRLEELFYLIKDDIEQNNMFNAFKSGIVLTGGTSKIRGIKKLCFKIFENQRVVKLDNGVLIENNYFNFADPMYSTASSLVKYVLNPAPYYEIDSTKNLRAKKEVMEIVEKKQPIAKPLVAPKKSVASENENVASNEKSFIKKILSLLDKHL